MPAQDPCLKLFCREQKAQPPALAGALPADAARLPGTEPEPEQPCKPYTYELQVNPRHHNLYSHHLITLPRERKNQERPKRRSLSLSPAESSRLCPGPQPFLTTKLQPDSSSLKVCQGLRSGAKTKSLQPSRTSPKPSGPTGLLKVVPHP